MEVLHVKENLWRHKTATRKNAKLNFQLTVSGANGANGVLAPKLVELDFKKGSAKYYVMPKMEDSSVVENLMKRRSV